MLVLINEEFIKDLFVEKKQLVVKNMKLKQTSWYHLKYIEMTLIISLFFFLKKKISRAVPTPLTEKQIIEDNFVDDSQCLRLASHCYYSTPSFPK